MPNRRASRLRELRSFLLLALSILSARSVVADWYEVPTGSMKPTILEGDRVFVLKSAYAVRLPFTDIRLFGTGTPRPGDVVVVKNPDGGFVPFVKRLVALPGDTVELRNETLLVNGVAQPIALDAGERDEDGARVLYGTERLQGREHAVRILTESARPRSFGPVVVPEGHVFLMGDNRDESRDSRYFGTRPIGDLRGRAVGSLWSWHPRWLDGPRPGRLLRPFSGTARPPAA